MIRVPGRCVYLSTPHTGSRATINALTGQCGGEWIIGDHHASLQQLKRLAEFTEPVITTLRDPRDIVLSRYVHDHPTEHHRKGRSVEQFVPKFAEQKTSGPMAKLIGPGLFPYSKYAEKFFLFENGLRPIFEFIGFPEVEIKVVGEYGDNPTYQYGPRIAFGEISDRAKELIELHFSDEIDFYEQVKNGC